MSSTTFIYGLIDPRTHAVRYVGKSANPAMRLKTHLKDKHSTHKVHWLNELRALGLMPHIVVIEEVPIENWQAAECFWIAHYKASGANLVNTTDGGENPPSSKGLTRSPETREKIRQAKLGKKRPAHVVEQMRLNRKGKGSFVPTQETIEKRRKTRAGYRHSDETRQKLSERTKQYFQEHPEARDALSQLRRESIRKINGSAA